MLNKDDAERIKDKLTAEVKPGRKHDLAIIRYNGKYVARYGIRRGSGRDSGHGHIPRDLHISPHQARELSDCPMSAQDYFTVLIQKGLLDE